MKTKTIFVLSLLGVSNIAFAEGGCPEGYYFTGRMIQGQGASYPECAPDIQQPQQPQGRWETRWGAIAIDDSKSRLGAFKGAKTKRQASKAAIAQCRAEGGGEGCKVKLTFYNQCSALAWGDTT